MESLISHYFAFVYYKLRFLVQGTFPCPHEVVSCTAPCSPHIMSSLFEKVGQTSSLHHTSFPLMDLLLRQAALNPSCERSSFCKLGLSGVSVSWKQSLICRGAKLNLG